MAVYLFATGIKLKTIMASTTQTLIFAGGLCVGFRGEINCNLLQKFNLQLELAFSFSPHSEYGILFTGQFIIVGRSRLFIVKTR